MTKTRLEKLKTALWIITEIKAYLEKEEDPDCKKLNEVNDKITEVISNQGGITCPIFKVIRVRTDESKIVEAICAEDAIRVAFNTATLLINCVGKDICIFEELPKESYADTEVREKFVTVMIEE